MNTIGAYLNACSLVGESVLGKIRRYGLVGEDVSLFGL